MDYFTSSLFIIFLYSIPFILIGSILWVVYKWVKQFINFKQEQLQLLKVQNDLLRELIKKIENKY